MKKAGFYSPYLDVLGGGEFYSLGVLEWLLTKGYQVDLFWPDETILKKLTARFNFQANKNLQIKNFPSKQLERLGQLKNYDHFFYMTDGSLFFSSAKNSTLLIQSPVHMPALNLINWLKLKTWHQLICYSSYMQKALPKPFKACIQVIYPPVNNQEFQAEKKAKIILSVGRFFCQPNNKKHQFLIKVFQDLLPQMTGWQLIIAGSLSTADQARFKQLKKAVQSPSIKLLPNLSFNELKALYGKAAIYWHAAGYAEDLVQYPEKAEHFGITTVEAMASGAVPVVIEAGGQPEIVTHGQNGLLWQTKKELIGQTLQLIKLDKNWQRLSRAAQKRAQDFSKAKFFQSLNEKII
ncbi:glycosyltransferase family 4 protein [Patescibacteria group bacterium]|nr:glycosyltransferase family 4 protein [Patescibacteria group bacterium]